MLWPGLMGLEEWLDRGECRGEARRTWNGIPSGQPLNGALGKWAGAILSRLFWWVFCSRMFIGTPVFAAVGTFVDIGMLIAGGILLPRGLRGYPSLADPTCMKCGYDLRGFVGERPTICSECGADLTKPYSIRLAVFRRHAPTAWIGGALLLGGLLGIPLIKVVTSHVGAVRVAGAGQSPFVIATQTNAQIIANLPTTAGQPWAWQELERRFSAGTLPTADVTAAVDQLIRFRSTSGANRTAGPLSWSEPFLTKVNAAHLIPPEQFDRLVDAFFGPAPVITIASTVSSGPTPVRIEYGGPWDLLGSRPIFALRSVRLDGGTPVVCVPRGARQGAARNVQRLSRNGAFPLEADLYLDTTPGVHHLTFIVDTGVIDQDTRQLISGSEVGQADQWPSNIRTKQRQVDVPITYVAAGTPTIEQVTSTENHQWPPYRLRSITAIPGTDGTRIKALIESVGSDVDCEYDVSITVGGERQSAGIEEYRSSERSSSDHTITVSPALSPDVTSATVTLTPNIERASRAAGMSRVWGLPVEFKDVPLRRLDLPAGTEP